MAKTGRKSTRGRHSLVDTTPPPTTLAEITFDAIGDFRASGGDDYRVMIPPAKDARQGAEPIELRAIKLTRPSGEDSFYLTSLRRAQFSRAQIAELYRLRWQAEELFKLEKSVYFDQRQFHAKPAHRSSQLMPCV